MKNGLQFRVFFGKMAFIRNLKFAEINARSSRRLRYHRARTDEIRLNLRYVQFLKIRYLWYMDVHAQKLKLIEWILQIGDTRLLKQLESISNSDSDWWNDLSAEEKSSIERGIAQANSGQLKSNEAVMKKYQRWD